MIKKITIDEILQKKDLVFIDVRSPKEFNNDTIPGAINIPVLNDEEREDVGYLYNQVDKQLAKEKGLHYASNKLVDFYKKAIEIKKDNKDIALFCYRGGLRSNSIANVLGTMGLEVYIITGGYKSYRNYVLNKLKSYKDKFKYIVLHGYTGVGKTKLLKLLENNTKSIIDLEGLARNSGSVFGGITFNNLSNTQKKFESLLLKELENANDEYIFIESESRRIGKVVLPDFLYKGMDEGYHILIQTSIENRVYNIYDDYIKNNTLNKDEKIIESIKKLRKRLGNNKVLELKEKIENKNYSYVIKELMVNYYDPLYLYSIDKIKSYDKIIEYEDIKVALKELIKLYNVLNN